MVTLPRTLISAVFMLFILLGCETPVSSKGPVKPPTPVIVTLTFDSQGGSMVESQTLIAGDFGIIPEEPLRPGYQFMGWTSDLSQGIIWEFALEPIEMNMILWAIWEPLSQVTVTFDSMGGTIIESMIVYVGSIISVPPEPSRANYTFAGWYTTPEYWEYWDFENSLVDQDVTLYANWEYIEGSPETFLDADQPVYYVGNNVSPPVSGFMKPWNYDKPFNSHRKYPIIISLHGSGAPNGSMIFEASNAADKRAYPAFLLAPHTATSDWGTTECTKIVEELEALKAQYRIDTDRIYVTGFSMGGPGIYTLADTLYSVSGQIPAAIVRFSGQ